MLVLTRKENESIRIGNDIEITLVRVRGGGVRIGIEAPRDVKVLRGELAEHPGDDDVAELRTATADDSVPVGQRPALSMAGPILPLRREPVTPASATVRRSDNPLAATVSA